MLSTDVKFFVSLALCLVVSVFGITCRTASADAGKFGVYPSKYEIFLRQGESASRQVTVSNRTNVALRVDSLVEDFLAVDEVDASTLASARQNIIIPPEFRSFVLSPGGQANVQVVVSAPLDAKPGGRYATAVFAARPLDEKVGNTRVTARLGVLFFVTVSGKFASSGELREFGVSGQQASVLFENKGDAHLNPYGVINVTNWRGSSVAEVVVDPWFVLPHSVRVRHFEIGGLPAGWYLAKLELNRGYDDIIDKSSARFVVWPSGQFWWLVVVIIITLVLLFIIWRRRA